jgi:hypothetical protein
MGAGMEAVDVGSIATVVVGEDEVVTDSWDRGFGLGKCTWIDGVWLDKVVG